MLSDVQGIECRSSSQGLWQEGHHVKPAGQIDFHSACSLD
jgi:hypothetical protein